MCEVTTFNNSILFKIFGADFKDESLCTDVQNIVVDGIVNKCLLSHTLMSRITATKSSKYISRIKLEAIRFPGNLINKSSIVIVSSHQLCSRFLHLRIPVSCATILWHGIPGELRKTDPSWRTTGWKKQESLWGLGLGLLFLFLFVCLFLPAYARLMVLYLSHLPIWFVSKSVHKLLLDWFYERDGPLQLLQHSRQQWASLYSWTGNSSFMQFNNVTTFAFHNLCPAKRFLKALN